MNFQKKQKKQYYKNRTSARETWISKFKGSFIDKVAHGINIYFHWMSCNNHISRRQNIFFIANVGYFLLNK